MYPSVSTIKTCIICRNSGATGQWQLCPTCRAELVRRSAERQSRMAPDHCMSCFTPKRGLPVAGSIYCPRCYFHYNGRRKAETHFATGPCTSDPDDCTCPRCARARIARRSNKPKRPRVCETCGESSTIRPCPICAALKAKKAKRK